MSRSGATCLLVEFSSVAAMCNLYNISGTVVAVVVW